MKTRPLCLFALAVFTACLRHETKPVESDASAHGVAHASADAQSGVAKLAPTGTLMGRVTLEGTPIAGATVSVRDWTLSELQGGGTAKEDDFYWSEYDETTSPYLNEYGETTSPYLFSKGTHETHSDYGGRFRVEALKRGDYRVEVTTASGERRAIEPVRLGELGGTDMGDVGLMRTGTLRGRVIVPPGCSPQGIPVTVWAFDIEAGATIDADGRFELAHRPPGRQHLHFGPKQGVITDGPILQVDIGAGEIKELEFDLTSRAGCFVQLEVLVNGEQVHGVLATLESVESSERCVGVWDWEGVEARCSWQLALGVVDGRVQSSCGMPLGAASRIADLEPGGEVTVRFDLTCGGVSLEWPELPSNETLQSARFRAEPRGSTKTFRTWCTDGYFDSTGNGVVNDARMTGANSCKFDRVAVGDYDWTVEIVSSTPRRVQHVRVYRNKLTVRARETVECVLTEADRVE